MIDANGSQPVHEEKPGRLAMAALIAAALAIRIGILAVMPETFVADPDNYRILAVNITEHGCFGYGDQPIASRPVLYPLLVAACRIVDPALWSSLAIVHVILGVATVVSTYCLALRWGVGKWSLLAAALVAADPILLAHSALIMTETLATFLSVAGLLAATRCAQQPTAGRAALAAGVMALAVLCRPTFLVWMGLTILLMPLAAGTWRGRLKSDLKTNTGLSHQHGRTRTVEWWVAPRIFGAGVLVAALILSPWAIRNAVGFGKATVATTHGGYTLLLANNARYYHHLQTARAGEVWDAEQFNRDWNLRVKQIAPGDETAADRLAYADALAVIRSQPRTFVYSCLVRVGHLWGLVPHRTTASENPLRRLARWSVGVFYTIESLLAILGVVCLLAGQLPRHLLLRGWIWGLLLVVTFTAIHTFYWTNVRMRAPLIPVVCSAAALGAAEIARRQTRRKEFRREMAAREV